MRTLQAVRRRTRLLFIGMGLMALALVAAACSDGNGDTPTIGGLSPAQVEALAAGSGLFTGGGVASGTGIHATGTGTVSVVPDLAVLSLGVEGFARSVSAARDIAATALDGIIATLRGQGIDDDDIATRYFNIQPEYTYQEVVENGLRHSERKLVGYRVNNTLSMKVRDLDRIGAIIDGTVAAGGDATRINSISFTLEDRTAAAEEARKLALAAALARADLYADELDVKRGKLVFVTETGSPAITRLDSRVSFEGALAAPAVETPVLAGELDVVVTVQTVFAID